MSVERVAYKSIEGIEAWLSRFGWGISPVKNDDSILRCWLNSCKAWVRARVLYMCSLAKDRYLSRRHHHRCCTGGSQRVTYGWRASRSSAVGINTGTGLFSPPLFRLLYSSLPIVDYFSYITTFFRGSQQGLLTFLVTVLLYWNVVYMQTNCFILSDNEK